MTTRYHSILRGSRSITRLVASRMQLHKLWARTEVQGIERARIIGLPQATQASQVWQDQTWHTLIALRVIGTLVARMMQTVDLSMVTQAQMAATFNSYPSWFCVVRTFCAMSRAVADTSSPFRFQEEVQLWVNLWTSSLILVPQLVGLLQINWVSLSVYNTL